MGDTDYDAVVVGSGAGGAAAAWALSAGGLRVLVLEAGPAYDPERDYRLHLATWEQGGFPEKAGSKGPHAFAELQSLEERWKDLRSWNHLYGRLNPSGRRKVLGYQHVRGVGGTTLHFTAEAHRLHPQSMKMASRFGVAADWPLDYTELEPFYARAEAVVGVAGPNTDPARWRNAPYPLGPHRLSYASTRLAAGSRELGLSWTPNPVAVLSAPYDGRPECNYCDNCARGCPRRDKGSVDVTFIPKALATGRCTILTGCQVIGLDAGSRDRVTTVHYIDAQGKARQALGRAVVLAGGAVETPRLLLATKGAQVPDGLGNESGQVGRHFMETLSWVSSGLYPEPLASYRGIPSDSICWDYNAPDAVPGVAGGCRFSPGVAEAGFLGPIAYARRVAGGWGRAHKKRMRETFGRVLSVGSIGEYLPNPGTYVDLDPEQQDAHGIPLARIHGRLEEMDLKRLAFMAGKAREILKASGVDALIEEIGTYDLFNATHVFGTCRMGRDPKDSVVDRFGRSHRWRNLFVADASVFPSTGGGEAPSLTIEALAIRSADHIRELAARREL